MNWENEIKNLEGWHFGGKGSGIEDSLAELVVKGIKTGTCSWFELYEFENEPIPQMGHKSYIMDSQDRPICVIEVTSIEVKKFLEVDEEFARSEGEGDLSYDHWKKEHERFFTELGEQLGMTWNSETQSVVCERFKVLHIFAPLSPSSAPPAP